MRFFALALLLSTSAASAQTEMSAAEFEAYATGKTLTYAIGGQIYGVEQYLPNRRVRWAFVDDSCQIGHWYEEGEDICFVYDETGAPQCWRFYLDNGKLSARFRNDPPGTELSEVQQTTTPLACTGPDVGV